MDDSTAADGIEPVAPRPNRRPWIIGGAVALVVAVVVAIVLILSGGDDDDDASDITVGTTTAPSTAATETTVPETSVVPEATENIVEVVAGNPDFSTLADLLESAGLTTLLSETGPYTLFAPDNEAFDALSSEQLDNLQSDPELARNVLAYQIVLGTYPTSALTSGRLTSLEGGTLRITVRGSTVLVNTAKIVVPDLAAANGVVQGIDELLIPPGTDIDPAPPATTTTEPPTTEAPTTAVPETTAAPATTAGTSPPATTAAPTTEAPAPPTTEEEPTTTPAPSGESLYDVLSASPEYSIYLQLVDAAGLTERLSDPSNAVTLFAPTNGAFGADAATQDENIQRLLALPQEDLVAIVAYHAVGDVLAFDDLVPGDELPTLNAGQSLSVVEDTRGFVQIRGAQNVRAATVVDPDHPAGTSIIQGVDRLLIPDGVTRPDPSPGEPDDADEGAGDA